jgi:DNA-binding MarR family transcriptional regulator
MPTSFKNKVSSPKASEFMLSKSTGYLVRKTFRNYSRALEMRIREHDLTISMWFFLRLLWEGDGQTQKELGDELGLVQPTTVSAMDMLERHGLIDRIRNSKDRRRINIFLTAKGHALKKQMLPFADEVNKIALENVSVAELKTLWSVLDKINRSLLDDLER